MYNKLLKLVADREIIVSRKAVSKALQVFNDAVVALENAEARLLMANERAGKRINDLNRLIQNEQEHQGRLMSEALVVRTQARKIKSFLS